MQDQSRRRSFASCGPPQPLRHQLLHHSRAHGVTHYFARKDVLDACQVKPPFVGGDVGDVTDPGFVRARRRKGLIQQVGRHRVAMLRIRRRLELPFLLAAQSKFPPRSNDAVTPCVESLRDQLWLQAQRPVGFARLHMGCLDGDLQAFIVLRSLRRLAIKRRVEATARHLEHAAQQTQRIFESHRFHERVPGSDSLAKYAVAFFSTSFSIRSTTSSLRSLATSASSSTTLRLPGGADGSVPRLAALTQFARVPLGIAIRCADSSNFSPCASTSLTASALNSGVYVVDLMISLPLTSLSNGSVRKCQATSSANRLVLIIKFRSYRKSHHHAKNANVFTRSPLHKPKVI